MKSNLTLKSNIYINRTAQPYDRDFLRHITDYLVLRQYKNGMYADPDMSWMTLAQKEILSMGPPVCMKEIGTMSWGVPVSGDHLVCRCEQTDCRLYPQCSAYSNFEKIQRDEEQAVMPVEKTEHIAEKPAQPEISEAAALFVPDKKAEPKPAVGSSEQLEIPEAAALFVPEEKAKPEPAAGHGEQLEIPEVAARFEQEEKMPEPIRQKHGGIIPKTQLQRISRGLKQAFEAISGVSKKPAETEKPAEAEKTVESEKPVQPSTPTFREQSAPAAISPSEPQQVEQQTIIEAPVQSRIWVNAGPGTGKTYTVIQRLLRLMQMDLDGAVLVLCFSRNAVQVIRERLEEALGQRLEGYLAEGRLEIRTFDSFASYMLEDELNTRWDYDQRIDQFIQAIGRNKESLNDMFCYLIVDEIQDTVGPRARMLLALLDALSCGALLLGDRCQAIFDWTIRESGDMTFDVLREELKKRNIQRYELDQNRRQSKTLAEKGQELRQVILSGDEAAQENAVKEFKSWVRQTYGSCKLKALPQNLSGVSEMILCKTNGEAAYVSQKLFDSPEQVNHTMMQDKNHRALAAWIAKALRGNNGVVLGKDGFFVNAEAYQVEEPEAKWEALKSLDGHPHSPSLYIQPLLSALKKKDGIPDICLNRVENSVVVSTVHRAKGSEAAHVFWLDSPLVYENQQEQEDSKKDAVKAAYVAATRAKEDVRMVDEEKNVYLWPMCSGRWIQVGYKNGKPYCKGIALLPDDTISASFVPAESDDAIQDTLSCMEPGLPVTLYANQEKNRFDIFFDGQMIGCTESAFVEDLFAGFAATNHNKNWPDHIEGGYIASVVTLLETQDGQIAEPYQKAGCWLGIELGGLPLIYWS